VAAYKKAFREHMGMPLNGPEHLRGTAFFWKHKNVLFISVDVFEEIDIIPSGPHLWQPGNNRPLEKVEIRPETKKRGFVPVGRLTIDTRSEPRKFKNPPGYFLKKFEMSVEWAKPGFKGGRPLPRINLDGSVSD
jgi:hypothetical protein